jgi:uncharacterized membrane protein (Fun14 family)
VNDFSQKAGGVFTEWFANGPWRSKTVLVALALAVVGLWFWYSDIRNSLSLNESVPAGTKTTEPAPASPAGAPQADSPSKWSKPFPWYARMSFSYVGGYCIGWLFRKVLRLILLVIALAIALLAYGKFAGFDLKHTQEQVKQGGAWAQREATAVKDRFKHLLPSATAAGVGIFLGFLRRNRPTESKPAA